MTWGSLAGQTSLPNSRSCGSNLSFQYALNLQHGHIQSMPSAEETRVLVLQITIAEAQGENVMYLWKPES